MTVGDLNYLAASDEDLLRDCDLHLARGSGPGGQKRNKTETSVRLRHRPTGIAVQCDESRSQHRNRELAVARLRRRLALQVRRPLELITYHPGDALRELLELRGYVAGRRSGADLPAIAELLDLFVALGCSLRDTATRLGVSTASLSKLLLRDADVGHQVNLLRAQHRLRPLR